MSFPVYLDDDSGDTAIADGLLADGVDLVRSADVGMRGRQDEEQLELATREGRVLVTANRGDFLRLHRDWMRAGRSHAGLVIIIQGQFSVGERLRRFRSLLEGRTAAQMTDAVEWLSDWGDGTELY